MLGGDGVAMGFAGAYERAGHYDVFVEKTGFKQWMERQVRVGRDECHVLPVRLEARLEQR